MDIGKIHNLIGQFEECRKRGQHVDIEDRRTVERVRTTAFLDRVDCNVLVRMPEENSTARVVWESYEGVSGYQVEDGVLSILVGGNDSDGDWGTVCVEVYPDGRWLKFETELTPVPNPYYEAPTEDEDEEPA